ncbi:MAG: hypothetical protein ACYTDV_20505 [Planctomycetota bacterium]
MEKGGCHAQLPKQISVSGFHFSTDLFHFAALPRRRACSGGENIEKRLKFTQFEPESTGCKTRPARQGGYAEPEQLQQAIREPAACTKPGTESVQLGICQPQPVGPEPKHLEQDVGQKIPEPIQYDHLKAVGSQPKQLEQNVCEPLAGAESIELDIFQPQPVSPEPKQLEQNIGEPIEP